MGNFKKDPVSTIIKRRQFAERIRNVLYGRKQRPYGRAPRSEWVKPVIQLVGKGWMRYTTALHLVEELKEEIGEVGEQGVFDKDLDDHLLFKVFEKLEANKDEKNRWEWVKTLHEGRREAWARDAIHQGKCPVCGSTELAECGHGFDNLEMDGTGGFTQYVQ